MNSKDRRENITDKLLGSLEPLKGSILANEFGVTRQVIVKDIAILRAEGKNIISTPDGYIIPRIQDNRIRKIIAVNHRAEDIEDELTTIVNFGGIIEDVIVEHAIYGELKGMLMIKSLYDIKKFLNRLKNNKSEPLLVLTGGIHLHSIVVEDEDSLENIIKALDKKGYLISD